MCMPVWRCYNRVGVALDALHLKAVELTSIAIIKVLLSWLHVLQSCRQLLLNLVLSRIWRAVTFMMY